MPSGLCKHLGGRRTASSASLNSKACQISSECYRGSTFNQQKPARSVLLDAHRCGGTATGGARKRPIGGGCSRERCWRRLR
jgi:hypothetical protein